jgi:cytochrome c oxidase assembly protein subunit 15
MFIRNIKPKNLFTSFSRPGFAQAPKFSFSSQLVKTGKERLVGGWLFLSAAGVLGMIVLGGYTRLTHSGLSMADWSPYTQRYPRNADEWEVEFEKYKKTIEFQTVNRDIDLEKFKPIYWVEFFHRQMGMVLGYWFIIPFAIFQYKGFFMPKMRNRMLALLGLGGLQGAIGWWMVKSGLKEKP